MPAIIVNEVQEPSHSASSNFQPANGEPLEARESRNNIFGFGIQSNDNSDEYEDNNHVGDELSTSYNNILLSPQGIVPFAPYPLINQQRQHLRNVLFRRVAPIQSESISRRFVVIHIS